MSTTSARRYGFVGLIVTDRQRYGTRVNQILSAHGDCIIGRFGMPNLEDGAFSIVMLVVHASTERIGSLTGKLGAMDGVLVRSGMYKADVP